MPATESLDPLLEQVGAAALDAGVKVMQFYRPGASFALKADASPLTAADLASHDHLVAALDPLLPGVTVVSEESQAEAVAAAAGHERYWLVDPLDGTKEFLKQTNEFTVNVALIERGRPVLGVVHAPALALTYWARQGAGAWRQSGGEPVTRIRTRAAEPGRLAVVASKDHAGPTVSAMLARMPAATLTSMGSSLKFCLVAEGKADIYLRDLPTMEWDTAAAQCVVEAAGGAVCELSGAPLPYGKPGRRNGAIITVGDCTLPWQRYLGTA